MKYVLITSSRNEEKLIAHTLDSVTRQTQLPERWIIVDDGSTDRTGEIAGDYAKRFPWIEVVHNPPREGRSFAAKANTVNAAFAKLEAERVDFEVVGNLDADTEFRARLHGISDAEIFRRSEARRGRDAIHAGRRL